MTIEKSCILCQTLHTIEVPESGYNRWKNGELIQRALPGVSEDNRELLMSGMCGGCFESIFDTPQEQEYSRSTAASTAYAKQNKWDVIFPRTNELQIDLDSIEAVAEFDARFAWAKPMFDLEEVSRKPSKSGGDKKHVTLKTQKIALTDERRVLLQAILGSDFKKEAISFKRIVEGEANPVLFFEAADKTH